MTACEHQWEWVQPVIHIIGDPLGLAPNDLHTYNARCSKCGETTWAHGWTGYVLMRKEATSGTP